MALEGSLRDFGLADILQLIYFQKKTGLLVLSGQLDKVKLMFLDGNVVSAESRKRIEDERLGKILLKKGIIKDSDLRSSLEEQKKTGAKLGDIVLKRGLAAREDIAETLLSQMTETVVQLFSWKEGTYWFESQPVSISKDIPVTIDTQHLLMEGLRIIDEWSLVGGKITFDTVFRRTEKADIALTYEEQEILRYVDGENDVSIIIDLGGIDDFQASLTLNSLMERGIIDPVRTSPVAAAIEMAPVPAPQGLFIRFLASFILLIVLAASFLFSALHETWSQRGLAAFWSSDSLRSSGTVRAIDRLRFKAEAYKYENGSYPPDLRRIGDIYDAWGRPYAYEMENDDLVILSAGPDGKIGTGDDIY